MSKLSKHIKDLLTFDPFYGFVLLGLNTVENTSIRIAGVTCQNSQIVLIINPINFFALEYKKQLEILKHELLHLTHFHLILRDDYIDKYRFNVAADMVVNQHLNKALFDNGYFPEDYNLPPGESTNYYYYNLPEEIKDNTEHSWGDTLTSYEKMELMSSINEAITKAAGNVSQSIKNYVRDFKKPKPKINYKKYIRQFFSAHNRIKYKLTSRIENVYYPGEKAMTRVGQSKVLVFQDQSSSVSIKELKDFNNELWHLKKQYDVEAFSFDTEIGTKIEISRNGDYVIRTKQGGTNIACCIKAFENNRNVNSCIIFTDGYFSKVPTCQKKGLLFVICSTGTLNNVENQQTKIQIDASI